MGTKLARNYFQQHLVEKVLKITGGARLIVNLEGVIMPECGQDLGPYDLCMDAGLALSLLKRLKVKAVILANNYNRDSGPAAYQNMVQSLQAGVIVPLESGKIFADVDNRSPQKVLLTIPLSSISTLVCI
jgi:hypothetical protein